MEQHHSVCSLEDLKISQQKLQLQVGELKQLQTDVKGRILHKQQQLQTKLIDERKTKNTQTELMEYRRATHVRADTY